MSQEKSELEQVYVELIDTLKKHLDVKDDHIGLLKQRIEILDDAVARRDDLLKIYEKAMAGTESANIAKKAMDKEMEEHKSSS